MPKQTGDRFTSSQKKAIYYYADDLDAAQVEILKSYARSEIADIEVQAFPPKLKLALYSRSVFLKRVFWESCPSVEA